MAQYRESHDAYIDSVVAKVRSLPALRNLLYDFGDCWKYEIPNYEARIRSVSRVMDSIRSMSSLEHLYLVNMVWYPERPMSSIVKKKKETMSLESLSLIESHVDDESFGELILQCRHSLKTVKMPYDDGKWIDRALRQCPCLETLEIPCMKTAASLGSTAPHLTKVIITTSHHAKEMSALEVFGSPLFGRLEHLSIIDGDFDDSTKAAIVQSCTNLKTFHVRECSLSIMAHFRRQEDPEWRSARNTVIPTEILNGSCPKLVVLNVGRERKNEFWSELLKKLRIARPNLCIVP